MTGEICGDNRFELVKKYHDEIVKKTNIIDSEDEMDVLDNILLRMWQIGWLDALEKRIPKKVKDGKYAGRCECGKFVFSDMKSCPNCGQTLDWGDKNDG